MEIHTAHGTGSVLGVTCLIFKQQGCMWFDFLCSCAHALLGHSWLSTSTTTAISGRSVGSYTHGRSHSLIVMMH